MSNNSVALTSYNPGLTISTPDLSSINGIQDDTLAVVTYFSIACIKFCLSGGLVADKVGQRRRCASGAAHPS
jgi:hypothetical protein